VSTIRQFALAAALALSAVLSTGVATGPIALAASLPTCRYDDVLTEHRATTDWRISLLDPIYMLTRDYVPPKLTSVSNAGIQGSGRVRSVVLTDLADMAAAARRAGAPLRVTSAYRSWSAQRTLYNREIAKYGDKVARESVARPGHSEHQLGTTIDFTSGGSSKSAWAYNDWANTAAGSWIKQNGWRYGFVLSYPSGRKGATCYRYEPWHYRYVGREIAAQVRASGLTLREYLWREYH